MGMKKWGLIVGLMIISSLAIGQNTEEDVPDYMASEYNIGLNIGNGGVNEGYALAIGGEYKKFHLRLATGIFANNVGVTYRILPINEYFDKFWVVSLAYSNGRHKDKYLGFDVSEQKIDDVNSIILTTGLKFILGNRGYSFLVVGMRYSSNTTVDEIPEFKETLQPTVEFGLGISLYSYFK